MNVKIYLKETAQPIELDNVENAYTKGRLYCVYVNKSVHKYPIENIFRIIESY